MRVNVSKISARMDEKSGCVSLSFWLKGREDEHPKTFVLVEREAQWLVDCGKDIQPAFRDIAWWMSVEEYCTVICYAYSGQEAEWVYISIPHDALRVLIMSALHDPDVEKVLDGEGLRRIAFFYRPIAKFEYRDAETLRKVVDNIDLLKPFMVRLLRMARNSSDGQMATINVYPDPWDTANPSFGWSIWIGNERIINGGLIWHDKAQEYSIHT